MNYLIDSKASCIPKLNSYTKMPKSENYVSKISGFQPQISVFSTKSKVTCTNYSVEQNRCISNLLVTYFDWAFFLCLSPFRFIKKSDKPFHPTKFYIQLLFSGVLITLYILFTICEFRKKINAHFNHGNSSPQKYFHISATLTGFLFQLAVIKQTWFNQGQFQNIVNFVQSVQCASLVKDSVFIPSKTLIHLLCLLFTVIGILEPMFKLLPPSIISVNGTLWISPPISTARVAFFMVNYEDINRVVKLEDITSLDYFLLSLHIIGWIQR